MILKNALIRNSATLTSLLVFFLLLACGKEQPPILEIAEDPCDCATEVSAEFEILEILAPFGNWESDIRTPTDVILSQKNVEFKAKMENADQYIWYIGTEVLDTRSVIRYFDDAQVGQQIPISLVVRSKPNINCFPEDDGYDSVCKTLEVVYKCDTALMEGWFRVALEGSTDSLDIGFDIRLRKVGPSAGNCHFVDIYNYNGLGDTLDHYVAGDYLWRSYRFVKMDGIVAINPYNSFYYQAEMDFENVFHLYVSRGNPNFSSKVDPFPEIYHGRRL